MDEHGHNPYGIHSFHLNGVPNTDIVELNRKRKLPAEQFGLPIPKHKHGDNQMPLENLKILEKSQAEELFIQERKAYSERQALDDGPDPESTKDCNTFAGDSDSAISVSAEPKFEADVSKIWSSDWPSTSSYNWGFNSFKDTHFSSDNATAIGAAGKEEQTFMAEKLNPLHPHGGLHVSEELEEPIPEFGDHLDDSCSEFKYENIEQYTDRQLEDILNSNETNPNVYALSSGRWTVNQDAQTGPRRPTITIDQEFEQYFSTLLL